MSRGGPEEFKVDGEEWEETKMKEGGKEKERRPIRGGGGDEERHGVNRRETRMRRGRRRGKREEEDHGSVMRRGVKALRHIVRGVEVRHPNCFPTSLSQRREINVNRGLRTLERGEKSEPQELRSMPHKDQGTQVKSRSSQQGHVMFDQVSLAQGRRWQYLSGIAQ